MSENPWWHPASEDDWEDDLPPVVVLAPEYSAELPLSGHGQLPWQITKFSPGLLDRLAAWQHDFDVHFNWQNGWRSSRAREKWTAEAQCLAADTRAELGTRAELFVDLWPLQGGLFRTAPDGPRR